MCILRSELYWEYLNGDDVETTTWKVMQMVTGACPVPLHLGLRVLASSLLSALRCITRFISIQWHANYGDIFVCLLDHDRTHRFITECAGLVGNSGTRGESENQL